MRMQCRPNIPAGAEQIIENLSVGAFTRSTMAQVGTSRRLSETFGVRRASGEQNFQRHR